MIRYRSSSGRFLRAPGRRARTSGRIARIEVVDSRGRTLVSESVGRGSSRMELARLEADLLGHVHAGTVGEVCKFSFDPRRDNPIIERDILDLDKGDSFRVEVSYGRGKKKSTQYIRFAPGMRREQQLVAVVLDLIHDAAVLSPQGRTQRPPVRRVTVTVSNTELARRIVPEAIREEAIMEVERAREALERAEELAEEMGIDLDALRKKHDARVRRNLAARTAGRRKRARRDKRKKKLRGRGNK